MSLGELLSVHDALQQLLINFQPLQGEVVGIADALGRVLSEPILAPGELPPFENSSMDGFAVRTADVGTASPQTPIQLHIVGDIPAGTVPSRPIHAGQAMRVMTGAPIPEGCDAVVQVELTDAHSRIPGSPLPEMVLIYHPAQVGDNVRPRGQDVSKGEIVLRAGHQLRAHDVGFLSMLGISFIRAHRQPCVAVLSTGDELLESGGRMVPGKIYDANAPMIISLVNQAGGETLSLGIAPDRMEAVEQCLDRAVANHVDVIVSTAGVSVGAFDYVKNVVEKNGRLDFWRVNMRPGKPLAFGMYKEIAFFGLPGNPVSAFVGFEVFLRPALMKLSGRMNWVRQVSNVTLTEAIESDGRESYLRAIVTHDGDHLLAHLTGHQGSGNLRSLVQANALLLVPSGVKSLPIGSGVNAWLFEPIN